MGDVRKGGSLFGKGKRLTILLPQKSRALSLTDHYRQRDSGILKNRKGEKSDKDVKTDRQ